jgi:chromosome segregation ATPase
MHVEAFYQAVQSRWEALQRAIWPPTDAEVARGELANLRQELTRRYERMVQSRTEVEGLRWTLGKLDRRVAKLTARVAACCGTDEKAAWKLALRLDHLRQASDRKRARLEMREASYERQRAAFEKRKRELHQLANRAR